MRPQNETDRRESGGLSQIGDSVVWYLIANELLIANARDCGIDRVYVRTNVGSIRGSIVQRARGLKVIVSTTSIVVVYEFHGRP